MNSATNQDGLMLTVRLPEVPGVSGGSGTRPHPKDRGSCHGNNPEKPCNLGGF